MCKGWLVPGWEQASHKLAKAIAKYAKGLHQAERGFGVGKSQGAAGESAFCSPIKQGAASEKPFGSLAKQGAADESCFSRAVEQGAVVESPLGGWRLWGELVVSSFGCASPKDQPSLRASLTSISVSSLTRRLRGGLW